MKTLFKILMFALFVNLVWTIGSMETSPFYLLGNLTVDANTSIVAPTIDKWAIRGQIGDIMSGHFSALAFLAVALSIMYQSEANKQMRESIDKQEEALEQQNEALKVQSESLKAQIEELEASREESSKQTEEFFINNMNVKLDRYYRLLDLQRAKLKNGFSEEYKRSLQYDATGWVEKRTIGESLMDSLITVLNFIHHEISTLKDRYPNAYEIYKDELNVRLQTDQLYHEVYEVYAGSLECPAFIIFDT